MSFNEEEFYSRQRYIFNQGAMDRLRDSCVLVSGLGGLGAEIAKNLFLSGVGSLILQDSQQITLSDLSSQFYFSEDNLGENRAQSTYTKLKQSNRGNKLIYSSEILTESLISSFLVDVLVLTDALHDEKIRFGNYCHQSQIKFVIADTKGLFGQIFCDFGENFQVCDIDGKRPTFQFIDNITFEKNAVLTIDQDEKYNFDDGDWVKFTGVTGMTEINGMECQLSKHRTYSFVIGDTTAFKPYAGGGQVTLVKKPKLISFKSYEMAMSKPDAMICDYGKISMATNLHIAFQALSEFVKRYQMQPRPWNDNDADKLFDVACTLTSDSTELNKQWIDLFSKTCTGILCPMNSIIGGIASQEVLKAITGILMPLQQFFYFDAIECLPDTFLSSSKADSSSDLQQNNRNQPSRYLSQTTIFGDQIQKLLGDLRILLVGVSGVGCEILKNFCMTGIGCEQNGMIQILDSKSIKQSNLHRHFLFDLKDIGSMKSTKAAEYALAMNPSITVRSMVEDTRTENEHVFTDSFFENIDYVIDVTGHISTHKYLESCCIKLRKPLILGGTRSVMGSSETMIPWMTSAYSDTPDVEEPVAPIDKTLNFPHRIEQTVERAKIYFRNLFNDLPERALEYLRDPHQFGRNLLKHHSRSQVIHDIQQMLGIHRPRTFFDCIKSARQLFHEWFHEKISRILAHFPSDYVTPSGERFWKGQRLCPHVLEFDATNELHVTFIWATASLISNMYSINICEDRTTIVEQLDQIGKVSSQSEVDSSADFEADLNETDSNNSNPSKESELIEKVLTRLPNPDQCSDVQIRIQQLNLDENCSNLQLDMIVAVANLIADNYGIDREERIEIQRIAAHINPSIICPTSVTAGLICLELLKLAQHKKTIETFKNACFNLATPIIQIYQPNEAKQLRYLDHQFTVWDRFEIEHEMTIREFIDYFKTKHQVSVSLISAKSFVLYLSMMKKYQESDILNQKISERYEQQSKKSICDGTHSIILDLVCEDLDGNDIEQMPSVNYKIR